LLRDRPRRADDAALASPWTEYYEAAGDEPRSTLLYALDRFEEEVPRERFAVDLGCGAGPDTAELLRRGWRVLAIDGEAEAIKRLRNREDLSRDDLLRLQTLVSPFQEAEWPEADLVTSSFALPFCPPGAFPALWRRIERSLRPGGRFSGHLFGDRDGWSDEEEMTFHTRGLAEELLAGLDVEQLEELEEDGATATGKPKHWHVFYVVARRPQPVSSPRTGGR
jgi:tellurite methyltransferase